MVDAQRVADDDLVLHSGENPHVVYSRLLLEYLMTRIPGQPALIWT